MPECRAAWDALFAGPLAGTRITRVVVTHFHPDHVGLAGWLCARDAAPLHMARSEWLLARNLRHDAAETPPPSARAWFRMAGYDAAQVAEAVADGWGRFAAATSPLPDTLRVLRDGGTVRIGDRAWRVVVGRGHTPEHACLVDEAGGVMIAGDQVLPRITSNVSVTNAEPDGDPLGDWLDSIERLRALPPELLVLPAHGEPFTGLHTRLDALRDGHRDRLNALHAALDRPRTAIQSFPTLFRRTIGAEDRGLAAGEALAHLHRLVAEGSARRIVDDGVARFVAC